MRRVLLALAVMGLVTGAAFAQPETNLGGGVLITHSPAGVAYSTDVPAGGWCQFGVIDGCDNQLNDNLPADQTGVMLYVVAAFLQDSEWCGIEFGVEYTTGSAGLALAEYGPCFPAAGLQINTEFWPEPGNGIALTTTTQPWVGNFKPVYYFAAYAYASTAFSLIDNPGSPGVVAFANCQQEEFPPTCLGAFGFGDMAGVDCCPELPPPPSWACCLYDGSCIFVQQADCLAQDGVWYEGSLCEQIVCPAPVPCCFYHDCVMLHAAECVAQGGEVFAGAPDCTDNPCDDLTPAEPSSWGTIKAIYR